MNDLERLENRLNDLANPPGGRTAEDIFDAADDESSSSGDSGAGTPRRNSALAVAAALVLVAGFASWKLWEGTDAKLVTTPAAPTDVSSEPSVGLTATTSSSTAPDSEQPELTWGVGQGATVSLTLPGVSIASGPTADSSVVTADETATVRDTELALLKVDTDADREQVTTQRALIPRVNAPQTQTTLVGQGSAAVVVIVVEASLYSDPVLDMYERQSDWSSVVVTGDRRTLQDGEGENTTVSWQATPELAVIVTGVDIVDPENLPTADADAMGRLVESVASNLMVG